MKGHQYFSLILDLLNSAAMNTALFIFGGANFRM